LELQQDGRALPNAHLDLVSFVHLGSLARVEEYPYCHQSKYQHSKGQKLGPFRASAQQDYPCEGQQKSGDPTRGILIEDPFFSFDSRSDFQVVARIL